LKKQLEARTRELAEARGHHSEALEQQAATSEILRVISMVGMAQGILGTLRAAEALGGAIPQNVNFGITATTIIGFLQAHSVDYRIDTERTKFEPEQIAEEAKKFTVKVTCGD
jgi:hypothetical protein